MRERLETGVILLALVLWALCALLAVVVVAVAAWDFYSRFG